MKKVLIKEYKGIKIYFRLEDSVLVAKDNGTGECFKGKYVFGIEREIDKPVWEKHEASGFMTGGIFGDEIYKLTSSKRCRKTKKQLWVKGRSTGTSFDKGKELDYFDRDRVVYPNTPHNNKVYEQAEKQQDEINHQERVLKNIIKKLNINK